MEEQRPSPSIFNQMPPRFAFWAGVVTSAAVLSVVGFVVMTVLVVKGTTFGDTSTSTSVSNINTAKAAVTTGAATANTNTAAAIPTKTTVDLASVRNIRGSGDITIVEYSDLQCPFCASFHPTMQRVMKEYDGKVKWGYKHLPLTSIHPYAEPAAIASECAAEQGKFWEFADYVMANQSSLASDGINAAATAAGVKNANFDSCVSSKKTQSLVTADATDAASYGFRGTPSSLIVDKNGKVLDTIPGALEFDNSAKPNDVKRILTKYVQ